MKPVIIKNHRDIILKWEYILQKSAFYRTPKELSNKIQSYFDMIYSKRNIKPLFNKNWVEIWNDFIRLPSVSWLALFLGFTSRQSLIDYANKNAKFAYTIKRAKLAIETFLEERLNSWKWNTAGIIFNLKNNFWWKDNNIKFQDIKEADKIDHKRIERLKNIVLEMESNNNKNINHNL